MTEVGCKLSGDVIAFFITCEDATNFIASREKYHVKWL